MKQNHDFNIEPAQYQKIALGILVLATGLRFWNLAGTSLWFDEAVYLLNSQGSFAQVLENTQLRNSSPLGLPILLWLIDGTAGLNTLTSRLPSAIFGIGSVAVMLALPRVGVTRFTALLAAGLLAIGQLQVMYSQEVREYGLSILASAAILWAFLHVINNGRWRPLIILAVVTPWLSYGACFAVVAAIVSLAAMGFFKIENINWIAFGSVVAAFFGSAIAAYLLVAQHQLYTGDVWYFAEHYLSRSGMNPVFWLFANMAGVFLASLTGLISVIVAPVLLIVYLSRFAKKPLEIFAHPVVIITMVLAGGLIIAGIIEVYPYGSPRHSVFFGPFLCLSLAVAVTEVLATLNPERRILLAGGIGAVFASSAVISFIAVPLGQDLHPLLRKAASIDVYGEFEDNRGLFAWAREQAEDGRVLHGGPRLAPVAEIYGDGLILEGQNFKLNLKPESHAADILRVSEGRPVAVLINGPVPGHVEKVIRALRAEGVTVTEDFAAERTHGLLVDPVGSMAQM